MTLKGITQYLLLIGAIGIVWAALLMGKSYLESNLGEPIHIDIKTEIEVDEDVKPTAS